MEDVNPRRRSPRDVMNIENAQTVSPVTDQGRTREGNELSRKVRNEMKRLHIVGKSQKLLDAMERALRVAPTTISVLIIGESGSGKENLARVIHDNSPRKNKTFIPINCGALPEGTIDSELFGHVKGSFTGAEEDHIGYFGSANGGTIFLDEVGDMPLQTQVRLLRVLENGEYTPVGANSPLTTNVRIVAATNRDINQLIAEGRFREELFYRLSTVQISLPPLRERGNDLNLLIDEFVNTFTHENNSAPPEFTGDALSAMAAYEWRGNIRQLRNVVEQVCLFEAGNKVTATVLRERYLSDMGHKPEIVVANKAKYDYDHDREIIFQLIMQLHREIDELKARSNVTAHVNTSLTDLQRERHQLTMKSMSDIDAGQYTGIVVTDDMLHNGDSPQDIGHATEVGYTADPSTAEHGGAGIKPLDEMKRDIIEDALNEFNGNRRRAAEALGISERTLYRKIKIYGLG